jgi:hypothetical protein
MQVGTDTKLGSDIHKVRYWLLDVGYRILVVGFSQQPAKKQPV